MTLEICSHGVDVSRVQCDLCRIAELERQVRELTAALKVRDSSDRGDLAIAAVGLKMQVEQLTARVLELEQALQDKCHDLPTSDYKAFCDGCDRYQKEQFGKCRTDELEAERDRLLKWESASQNGHPTPCDLGPLCPYCEIDRLREDAERWYDVGFMVRSELQPEYVPTCPIDVYRQIRSDAINDALKDRKEQPNAE